MKTLIALIGVALFAFTTSAGATVNKGMGAEANHSFLIPAAVINPAPTSGRMHLDEALLEVNAEAMLEVESWMIHESYFVSPVAVAESEEPLKVEAWMVSEPNFSELTTPLEGEKTLDVEDWMMNESVWGHECPLVGNELF